jgi:O-antigen ligase
MNPQKMEAFATSTLLVLFVFSGLIKWLPFPVDPTILFGAALLVPLGLAARRGLPRLSPRIELPVLMIALFLLWYLFTAVYTTSSEFWQRKALTLVLDGLAFAVPLACFRSLEHLRYFRFALLVLAFGVLAVVFGFYATGNIRFLLSQGVSQGLSKELSKIPDYLTLGTILGIGALTALARPRVLNLLIGVAAIGAMLLLGARGPILFVVLLMALGAILYRRRPVSMRIGAPVYLLVFAAFGVAMTQWEGAERTLSRFTKVFEDSSDAAEGLRVAEFTVALDVITDQPFLGTGLGGYARVGYGTDDNIYPHNLVLESFAEAGIVGFLLFGSGIIATCAMSRRGRPGAAPYFVLLLFMLLNYMKSGGFVSARDLFMFLGVYLAVLNMPDAERPSPFRVASRANRGTEHRLEESKVTI